MSYLPWKLILHTCGDVIPSLDVDVTYLCWHHTLPGCWLYVPALISYPPWMFDVTYLWWHHTLPGCWCYIPVVMSYLPGMLMLHTCSDVIPSLDVDVTYLWWRHTLPGCWCHIPVVTSYPPWMLTCIFPNRIGWFLGIGNSLLLLAFTGLTEKASTWPEVKTQSIIWSILECKILSNPE